MRKCFYVENADQMEREAKQSGIFHEFVRHKGKARAIVEDHFGNILLIKLKYLMLPGVPDINANEKRPLKFSEQMMENFINAVTK